ncbi:hypothetical protein HY492_01075 [Candidatus Woesearchaeota archaeon]|nr:hypothetical protein [Candidatus Woesearchaeota archaeon]
MALMYDQLQALREKGWQPHQVSRATAILHSAAEMKTDAVKLLDSVIYWGALSVAILGNFVLSIVVIPILLAFDDLSLVLVIAAIAAAFGVLMDVVLREIEHLRHRAFIIPELFIPALALINIYIITNLTNAAAVIAGLQTHNPWIVSVMYVCGFSLPHFVLKWRRVAHRAKIVGAHA